ncbi:MAG: tRNA lysidine(34) synthetase TilS [bacterium]|nr:tRNA lysidine(34) synthetase TilS [bacterium]
MTDLFEKFSDFINKNHLISPDDHVLIAVSGGIDSVVLLHLFIRYQESIPLNLEVIHINHQLRGSQADEDQQFVTRLSKQYHLSVTSRKINVPKFIEKKGISQEEGARFLRYRFFKWALKRTGADWVALGHHADDQVETVIDHFLRGSGVKGLMGMPIRRDKFIRPLLFATRKEIETYAKAHSLHYQVDSTNEMTKYRRNRIRLELIPYLQQHFNPAISDVVLRTAQIMDEVESYMQEQAGKALETCLVNFKKHKIVLDINTFLNYFIAIQKYILYQILDRIELPRSILTSAGMDRAMQLIGTRVSGKRMMLTADWQLSIDHECLVIQKIQNLIPELAIELDRIYELGNGEFEFQATLIDREQLPQQFSIDRKIEYIDYGRIKGPMVIRNFQVGDRFHPLNLKGTKKLSDFFTDQKIPLHQRRDIPILVCDAGIIWIINHQIDDRFKITESTRQILKLQVSKKVEV